MSETTEVALIEPRALVPVEVFAPGGVLALLSKLEADARAVKRDISTPQGRAAIKSLAYKIARSKTALDEMGKKLTDDARAQIEAVNADRRVVRDRLDALADEVRAPLTAWENEEKARVAGHEAALAAIVAPPGYGASEAAAEIAERIASLRAYPARDWREFSARAADTLAAEIDRMEVLHGAAVRREAEQAELARLRAEAEERAQQEAARLQAEREARIAADAAEAARVEAERTAAAERARMERVAAAAAEQARAEQLAAERKAREAEQAAARAEAERIAAAERAEAARVAAAAQAERDREAAVQAERQRVAAESAALERAAAARAANREHKAGIHREVLADLQRAGLTEDLARGVIASIVHGEVRHVRIAY